MDAQTQRIIDTLSTKSAIKQQIYRMMLDIFRVFKTEMNNISDEVIAAMIKQNNHVKVEYRSMNEFYASIKFGGDTLVFMLHSNVFKFPPEHEIHSLPYIKEDPMRGYCGVIYVYNFLSDTIKFNRFQDSGYLITRIFVNKDLHFFMQGRKQFSFLYNDISNFELNEEVIRQVILKAMSATLDFDLYVPPFAEVMEMTLGQSEVEQGKLALRTGKRVGYKDYQDISDNLELDL